MGILEGKNGRGPGGGGGEGGGGGGASEYSLTKKVRPLATYCTRSTLVQHINLLNSETSMHACGRKSTGVLVWLEPELYHL